VDVGTTLIKAALIDEQGDIRAFRNEETPVLIGDHGCFDIEDYLGRLWKVISGLAAAGKKKKVSIQGISFSSQRATLIITDNHKHPLIPVYSWQGFGCAKEAEMFFEVFGHNRFQQITGMPVSSIYTVAKLAYLKSSQPDLFQRHYKIMAISDYITWRMGTGKVCTDHSLASCTGLYDISGRIWSEEILSALNLKKTSLPDIVYSGTVCGYLNRQTAGMCQLLQGLPIVVGGGDQQCAAVGAGAIKPGDCVLNLGTSAVAVMPLRKKPIARFPGILLLGHVLKDYWHAEGFMNSFGSTLIWAADLLGCKSVAQLESLAERIFGQMIRPCFFPFLAGVGTPDFVAGQRGAFCGLTLAVKKEEMAMAVIIGLVCELQRIINALNAVFPIKNIRLTGGSIGKKIIPQLLANLSGFPVQILNTEQVSLLGAAAVGWLGIYGKSCFLPFIKGLNMKSKQLIDSKSDLTSEEFYRQYLEGIKIIREIQ
jgi:xylulokinase